ncbi:hypothetical protein HPB49_004045 [Dermacentor silvarum]|uniref:Uncharacterized protein n=1 Tax=Dermacentor silvarum TaxID=543639 RepID=A0ACB8DHN9_DERSI|nr:uncharacterized protein LOC119433137 [Dermacentor silvarum]KAH7970335.1 hypothetical protein HPB49_004045 [Dermacentor silvarum]
MTVTAARLPLLLALAAAAAATQPSSPLQLPDVKFSCQGRATGYYADVELRCSVFHYCGAQGDRYSFVCPPKSTFNQRLLMCDYEPGALELCARSESLYNVSTATPRLRKPVTRPPTTTTTTPAPSSTPSPTPVAVFGKPRSTTAVPLSEEDEDWLDDEGVRNETQWSSNETQWSSNETQWSSNETRWSQPVEHHEDGGWQPSEPLFDRDALFDNLRSHESAVTYEEPRSGDSGANSFVVYDPSELGRPFYYQPEPASYEPPRPPWQPMAEVLLGRPTGNYYKTPSGYFEFRHRSSSRRRARSARGKRQLLLSRFFKRQPLRLPPPREEESGWLPSVHFPLRGFFPPDPPAWPSLRLPPAKSAAPPPTPFQVEHRPHAHAFGRPSLHPDRFLPPRPQLPPFSPELRPWSQLGVSYLPETMFVPPHVIPGRTAPPPMVVHRQTAPPPMVVSRQTAPPPMLVPRQTAPYPLLSPRQTSPPPVAPLRQAGSRLPMKRPPPRKKPGRRRRPTPPPRTTTRSAPAKDNRTYSWYGGWTTIAPPRPVPAKPTPPTPTKPRSTQLWSLSSKSPNSSSPRSTQTATLKLSATTPFSWERLRTATSTTTPRPATIVRVFSNKIGSSVMATAGTPRTTTTSTPPTTALDVKDNVIGNGRDRGFPFEFFTDVNKLVARTTPQPQPVYKPPASREPVTEVVTAISFSESAPAA